MCQTLSFFPLGMNIHIFLVFPIIKLNIYIFKKHPSFPNLSVFFIFRTHPRFRYALMTGQMLRVYIYKCIEELMFVTSSNHLQLFHNVCEQVRILCLCCNEILAVLQFWNVFSQNHHRKWQKFGCIVQLGLENKMIFNMMNSESVSE